ncbi:MAG: dienelactone hydrolase family protein [Gammaproteobacteria bacterium]
MFNIQKVIFTSFCIFSILVTQAVAAEQKRHLVGGAQYLQLKTSKGQPFAAYVAGPEHAKQGLLLIHGWWGLNEEMEAWANQFAVAGYLVMAVDLFNQEVTTVPKKARALMNGVKQSVANDKYMAVIKALSAPGRKLAILGRSYGANQALHAAIVAQEKVSATIVYYPFGEVITDKKILNAIKTPILGHFAQHDNFFTPDMLARFTAAIKNSGVTMTVNMYDAQHAFTNPAGKNFNMSAFRLSQQRTFEFLEKNLN